MTDLLVAGGGPAGLAVAIAARQAGFEVTVVDVAVPPIDKACGEGLLPDGVLALRALGVELDGGFPFRGIRFVGAGASVAADFPVGRGLGMRRAALHRALATRAEAAGVKLRWGARVEGVTAEGALVAGETVPSRWVIGADGTQSRVRRWAGLEAVTRESVRFGFRRHYRRRPWSEHMELYWGRGLQIYVTPVGAEEIGVTLISRDRRLRLDDALRRLPELAQRLGGAAATTTERGALTATRTLRAVTRGRVALVGDASGSADAITGEGLSLAFQQARALVDALAAGDLARYQAAHRRQARRPAFMAGLLLTLENRHRLRAGVLRALAARPGAFGRLLALHVGVFQKRASS